MDIIVRLLEAQLPSNHIDVTDLLRHTVTYISAISSLFVDRFERSLWFCHLEFDKEANYDKKRSEIAVDLFYVPSNFHPFYMYKIFYINLGIQEKNSNNKTFLQVL